VGGGSRSDEVETFKIRCAPHQSHKGKSLKGSSDDSIPTEGEGSKRRQFTVLFCVKGHYKSDFSD
jgi:hypothetical protein